MRSIAAASSRSLAVLLALGMTAGLLSACGPDAGAGSGPTYPLTSARPPTADPAAVSTTRAELVRVLGGQNLVLQDPQTAFRPAEGPALASAPRVIYQVILPDDPTKGYLVVYALRDVPTAVAAGADQAAYLATGPGRIQMPIGTRHVLRQVGATIVLYSWIPDGATDDRAPLIQDALETLGIGIDIPG